jgi:hypothetical protein
MMSILLFDAAFLFNFLLEKGSLVEEIEPQMPRRAPSGGAPLPSASKRGRAPLGPEPARRKCWWETEERTDFNACICTIIDDTVLDKSENELLV